MPWTGTGAYNLPPAYSPEINGATIDADRYNGLTLDVATGITAALAKNGENVPTANLPMGGFKHTGAAIAAIAGEYLVWGQAAVLGRLVVVSASSWFSFKGNSAANSYGQVLKHDDTVLGLFGGGASAATPLTTANDFVIRAAQGQLILSSSLGDNALVIDTGGNVAIAHALQVGSVSGTVGRLVQNSYTPAVLASTNVTTAVPTPCHYIRIGDMVIVQGAVTLDPVATGTTAIHLALPIASNLLNAEDLTGSGVTASGVQAIVITASVADDAAVLVVNINSGASDLWSFMFSYFVR